MQSKFLMCNFGKVHFKQQLNGKNKTLILLHGNASSAASFADLCKILGKEFDLICLDFPGHGLSEHIDMSNHQEVYGILGLRDIFVTFYHKLAMKNVYIAGNSLGANIAVQSLSFLRDIKGLILMASIHPESREDFFANILPAAPKELALKNKLTDAEIEIVASAFIHDSKKKSSSFTQMLQDIKKSDGNFREQLVHNMKRQEWPNELDLLEKYSVPLLYIGGAQDGFIAPKYYEILKKRLMLKDQQFQFIDDVSHVPHLEDPVACAKLITNFIKQ